MYKQSWPAQLRQSLFKCLSTKFNKSRKKTCKNVTMHSMHASFGSPGDHCNLKLYGPGSDPWRPCVFLVSFRSSQITISPREKGTQDGHERERERELQVWFGIRIQIWGKKIQRSTVWIAELRSERGGGSHWHFGFSLAMCLHRCFDQPVNVFWSHGLLCSGPTLNPNSHLRN